MAVYQAPELLLGESSKASLSSDVWSLSCTLIEMFVEEPIRSMDSTVEDTLSNIRKCMKRKAMPTGLRQLHEGKEVRKEWLEILMRGMNYDAGGRPKAGDILRVIVV